MLNAIARTLGEASDARGRRLEVIRIPGVGLYRNAIGGTSPASHMNFIIANGTVVVPVYGTRTQDAALGMLRELFPGRKVVGIPSQGVLRLWRFGRRLVPLHHPAGAAAMTGAP